MPPDDGLQALPSCTPPLPTREQRGASNLAVHFLRFILVRALVWVGNVGQLSQWSGFRGVLHLSPSAVTITNQAPLSPQQAKAIVEAYPNARIHAAYDKGLSGQVSTLRLLEAQHPRGVEVNVRQTWCR